jgi:hypothetical protein
MGEGKWDHFFQRIILHQVCEIMPRCYMPPSVIGVKVQYVELFYLLLVSTVGGSRCQLGTIAY